VENIESKIKSNKQRAERAMLWVEIVLFLDILLWFVYLLYVFINGGQVPKNNINVYDTYDIIASIIYSTPFIISVITFIMWFFRAYANLHQKVERLLYTEGWAVGSWFIPIINLYIPYNIMKELYSKTRNIIADDKNLSEQFKFKESVIGWWWLLWVISFVLLPGISSICFPNATEITILDIIETIISVPLTLITIKVIKDYSEMENLLIQNDNEGQKK
jgi:hypothetical protein